MEAFSCFKCDRPLQSVSAKCSHCGWNGGVGLTEQSERYLVLLALIYRIPNEGVRIKPYISRVKGSPRELAVLQHGDQCELEATKWRITGINRNRNTFFVKGFRIVEFPNRQIFDFEHGDPVDEIKEEMLRWRDLRSAYYEIWQLKKKGQLKGYLRRPENKKAVYRSRIQDESPYLG